MGLRDRFIRFMSGRYGNDGLNKFISIVTLVLLAISFFFRIKLLWYLALVMIVILYLRTFSRNYAKRYAENQKFESIKRNLFKGSEQKKKMKNMQAMDKEHIYLICPKCRKNLRVPRGRGRIQVHCPGCGTDFIENT